MAMVCCFACRSHPRIFISASFVPSLWVRHHKVYSSRREADLVMSSVGFAYLGVHLLLLGFIAFPTVVLARGKEYPIQGTVIALGTSRETTGGGSTSVFTH